LGKELAGEMFDALLGVNGQTIDDSLLALKRLIIEETGASPQCFSARKSPSMLVPLSNTLC
jgi:hypothetical protein